ncbi:MAG: sulfotransferase [Methylotenera sp.]
MKQLTQQQIKTISNNFQQGQRAIQLGLFSQAEKHFLDVLNINPNVIEAQASLAYIYAASKQHAKATTQLKALLKAKPNHAQTHHNLANSLYEQKLYDEAIQHYQAALKITPNFVDAHIHCGIAYRMTKNYDAAIVCLQRALDLDKTNARAFHVLGMVYVDIEDYNRALHCLECATGLAPKQAEYQVSFANALEKANLDFEAGLEYHKACETDPNYLDGFSLYGAYLLKNHRHDEALECAKRAEDLAPQNLDVIDQLGIIYTGMSNTDAALSQFNAALKVEPKRLSSLTGMEQVYQETGKLDAAIAICDEIIAIDATKVNGYLLKARVRKSKPDDGLAEHLIKFAEQSDLDEETRTIANFNLGKVYDDQNNFEQAFKYYANGNALKNKVMDYNPEGDEAKFSKLIEVFNTNLFSERQDLGFEGDLPVIIVGMPRSGTTLTEQIISSHPDVIGAGEVIFWGKAPYAVPLRLDTATAYPDCVKEINPEQARDIAKMYEATLQKIAGSSTKPKHITDKMPHNFLNLGLIALLFPNIKIIHTKRNPIDTCLSIFFQNFNKAHPYAFNLSNLGFHYKQYQRIMRHWHEVLPGRIMDINYEDTISDPEFWSRKLIDHIGLEWDDACLAPHKLERSVKTASHWQVRQPIYKTSVQRWKNYEEFLGPLIEALKD